MTSLEIIVLVFCILVFFKTIWLIFFSKYAFSFSKKIMKWKYFAIIDFSAIIAIIIYFLLKEISVTQIA
jgi:hypothetical protein